jgi:hypothetical protein
MSNVANCTAPAACDDLEVDKADNAMGACMKACGHHHFKHAMGKPPHGALKEL